MKRACLVVFFAIVFLEKANSQSCFEAYDQLFIPQNKTLPYDEFHKLELIFLENLNGCKAIDFNAISIQGEVFNLLALKGKVVVLNFWFTTCLPCLKEIPELNKLAANYSNDEVVFIGFARDEKDKLEAFFTKFGPFNYNIVPESTTIADSYKLIGWPQSMVIDKDGKVYRSWAGLTEGPTVLKMQIQKAIDECLTTDN